MPKGKSKKKNKTSEDQDNDENGDGIDNDNNNKLNSEDDEDNNNNSKNKNKNKKPKQKMNKKKLMMITEKKQERQEELLEYGKKLMTEIDEKYVDLLDADKEELFKDAMTEIIEYFDDEDHLEDCLNDEIFEEKKKELLTVWEDILDVIRDEWKKAHADDIKKDLDDQKQKTIEKYIASGVKIGPSNQQKKKTVTNAKQASKIAEKQKLRELKERLKQQQSEKNNNDNGDNNQNNEIEKEKDHDQNENEDENKGGSDNDNDKKNNNDKVVDDENNVDGKKKKDVKIEPKKKSAEMWKLDEDDVNNDEIPNTKTQNDDWSTNINNNKKKPVVKSNFGDESSNDEEEKPNKKQRKQPQKKKEQPKPKNVKEEVPTDNNKTSSPKPEISNQDGKTKKSQQQKPIITDEKEASNKDDEKQPSKNKEKQSRKNKRNVELRSPICVVMGHVDTGKTSLLDKIRHTSVQSHEVGGITQQIGATYLTIEYIKKMCQKMDENVDKMKYKLPGLLFIDTPGHESFSNLRTRGSSMCDIAVLVVDITGGIEKQTEESLKMLRKRKAPFIVALNKVDRCIDWKSDDNKDGAFLVSYDKQANHTKRDFENRVTQVKNDFASHGENAELYYRNKNKKKDISLVPTSAVTGEGLPDLLNLLVELTQTYMESRLEYDRNKFMCSVLEVKNAQGYGAVIDVILSNGILRKDDTIIVCGMNGPIETQIRALLLPHEASEMRVKGEFQHVDEVHASAGVRIVAPDLQLAVAGSHLLIVPRDHNLTRNAARKERGEIIEQLKEEVQKDYADILNKVDHSARGVYVQASTLGALEALITFLDSMKVPICGIGVGDICKQDVMKAAVMVERQPEYAVILAFNVKVQVDARELAVKEKVQIFEAEIIYHLFDMFSDYMKQLREKRKAQAKDVAVFPCEFRVIDEDHVFHNKDPFVLGCEIQRGTLRLNTPIASKQFNNNKVATPLFIGRVESIQKDKKDLPLAKAGDKVAIKIMGDDATKNYQVGRQFDIKDSLVSQISRDSIDALKQHFQDDLTDDDVKHLHKLKQYFNVR